MTAVPLPRIVRRHKPTPQLNHSAYPCGICEAWPLDFHAPNCNEVTGPQPAYPAEARVFRGLLIGLLIALPGWALAAFLIWS